MEDAFDADFSQVRVHLGPEARRLGAQAFASGQDLYFSPELYQPHTAAGRRLVAHELAHVVQQRAGRVRNPFGTGWVVVRDPGLEAEAERLSLQASRSPRILLPRSDLGKPAQQEAKTSRRTSATVQARPDPRLASFAPHVRAAIQRGRNAPSALTRAAKTGCGCLCGGSCQPSSGVVQRNGPGFQEPYEFLPDASNAVNIFGVSTARATGFFTTPPIRGWKDPFLPELVRRRPKKLHFGQSSRPLYRFSRDSLARDLKPRWDSQKKYVEILERLYRLGVSSDEIMAFVRGDITAKNRIFNRLMDTEKIDQISGRRKVETWRKSLQKGGRRFNLAKAVEDVGYLVSSSRLSPTSDYDRISELLRRMADSGASRTDLMEQLRQQIRDLPYTSVTDVKTRLEGYSRPSPPDPKRWGLTKTEWDDVIRFTKVYGETGIEVGSPVVSLTSSEAFPIDPDAPDMFTNNRYKVTLDAADSSFVETNLYRAHDRLHEDAGRLFYYLKEGEAFGLEDMSKHVSKVELNEPSTKGMKYSTKLRLAGGALNVLDWGSVAYRISSADPRSRHLVIGEELGGQIGGWGGSAVGTLVCMLMGIASGGVGLFVCGFIGGMALGIGGSFVGHHLADQFFTVAPIRQSRALPRQIYPYPSKLAELHRLRRNLELDEDGKVILPPDLENHPAFQPGQTLQFPEVRYR